MLLPSTRPGYCRPGELFVQVAALPLQSKQGASEVKETCPDKLQNAKNIEKISVRGKEKIPQPTWANCNNAKKPRRKNRFQERKKFFPPPVLKPLSAMSKISPKLAKNT